MAKFNSIEEINVWQEGIDLVLVIYKIIKNSPDFNKDFGLRDQIKRAAVSIPSNIAEGFERQTNPEFIRFLYVAKGSSGELRTQIYVAFKLDYISEQDYKSLNLKCLKISGMLMKLIQTLKP